MKLWINNVLTIKVKHSNHLILKQVDFMFRNTKKRCFICKYGRNRKHHCISPDRIKKKLWGQEIQNLSHFAVYSTTYISQYLQMKLKNANSWKPVFLVISHWPFGILYVKLYGWHLLHCACLTACIVVFLGSIPDATRPWSKNTSKKQIKSGPYHMYPKVKEL